MLILQCAGARNRQRLDDVRLGRRRIVGKIVEIKFSIIDNLIKTST